MFSIDCACAEHVLKQYRLKQHALEMFEKIELQKEHGIAFTWRNRSNAARIARILQKQDQRYQAAAEQRRADPERPYNPNNPYDILSAHAGNMPQSASSENEFFDAVSEGCMSLSYAEDMHSIGSASLYTAPQSQQVQGSERASQKRRRRQQSAHEVEITAQRDRIKALESQVEIMEQRRRIRQLEKQLEQLKHAEQEERSS